MPPAPTEKPPLKTVAAVAVLAIAIVALARFAILREPAEPLANEAPPFVLTPVAGPAPAPAPAPTAPTPAPAHAVSTLTLPAGEERLSLARLTADELYDRLQKALGRPITLLPADGTPWLRFSVDAGDGAPVLIAANRQTRQLSMVGRPDQLRAWRQIIAALDAPPAADRVTQVLAAEKTAAPQVRQAANFLMAQAQVQAQQPGAQPGSTAAAAAAAEAAGLLGNVEITNVEGTDLFVIRGNPDDVARVMDVIRQIEAMSRVSEPRVVIHPLAHVDSQAMAVLLQQVFAAQAPAGSFSLGPYYGPLLAVPLGRPNSVLLIGAPSTVAKATEILGQLDAPSQAQTQFEVFRLKNASAEDAQIVVERLFTAAEEDQAAAPPLGPKALVIAELRTNALIVRASPRDMEEVRALINEIDTPGGESVNELRVFKLRNSLAVDLAPVLQRAVQGDSPVQGEETPEGLARLLQMVTIDAEGRRKLESGVLSGVVVNADPRANALIVSAPADSMPLLAALIDQLDQPPDSVALLKVFTIRNGDAVALEEVLSSLFGAPADGGDGGGGGGQPTGGEVFSIRFSVDERTNSIIAAGSESELLVVESVLLTLDTSDARQRLNRVYKLKNANSLDVAFALQEWLTQKREIEQTAPGVTSPFQQIEREVVVVAEPNSNSLIVSATPSYYKEISDIIAQLDEQAPMVMIQVLIGEVRLDDADEFGVELGLQDSVLFDRSLLEDIQFRENTVTQGGGGATVTNQIVQSATLVPGFNFGNPATGLGNSGSDTSLGTSSSVGAQGLSHFAVNRVSDLGFGGFVLAASSESVSLLLRALQESRRLEVLSRPQIMALDNQTGRAFVGEIVPIITFSEINQFTGQPQNYISQEPVGLELLVRPRISPEDLVVMEVYAAKRELGPIDQGVPVAISPNGDPINVPRINSTEAETTVSAVSGQTVVLSGLLTKRDEALHRRVPLLADIPLVGDLFRYDAHRQRRTELLIILTPHVIRSRYQAEMIKQVESARMSWCLADVVDMHGPAGLRSRLDPIGGAEAPAYFPTETPGEGGVYPGMTVYPNTMAPTLAEPLPPGAMITPPNQQPPGPTYTPPTLPPQPPPDQSAAPILPPQPPVIPPQN